MFDKVLIANRGEIAVRVIRACRELGVKTVAVYSDEDRDGLHARLAAESRALGGGGNARTYLNIDKIVGIALETGADAVHPGYGFLSERTEFCDAVEAKGITFIGPKPKSIAAMGSKTEARAIMEKAGVPLTPGSPPLTDTEAAKEWAREIGYPVMLKASYGGGGMGMIVVHDESELAKRFETASAQALAAFGNGEMFLEKFLTKPRHIEIQVARDADGEGVYVGERECSIQRRFQKLIEEAPSPVVDDKILKRMGEASLLAAEAVEYVNVGTCEYIFEDGDFFFNEMNTRLQVEHPVTEMVYGVDLVHWQLHIASGEALPRKQKDLVPNGWAIEARVNAEDPFTDFMPTPGPVATYLPPGGPGIRIDSHLYPGYTVPSAYDSMVAKVIAWGEDRQQAIGRLHRGLSEYDVGELTTNIPFHLLVLRDDAFVSGDYHTGFVRDSGIMDRLQSTRAAHEQAAERRLAAAIAGIEAYHGTDRYMRLVAAARSRKETEVVRGSKWKHVARRESLRRGVD
ncbi:MAG: acetyl-CoA carboxylase biotin carboxylase subunit [Euryarchaeota archaeon]|nr:acetyl-CoA carboxylase biotin carboxylase subunit [Euryarchaeota archaeon]